MLNLYAFQVLMSVSALKIRDKSCNCIFVFSAVVQQHSRKNIKFNARHTNRNVVFSRGGTLYKNTCQKGMRFPNTAGSWLVHIKTGVGNLRSDLLNFCLPISHQVSPGGHPLLRWTHNFEVNTVPLIRVISTVILPVACQCLIDAASCSREDALKTIKYWYVSLSMCVCVLCDSRQQ